MTSPCSCLSPHERAHMEGKTIWVLSLSCTHRAASGSMKELAVGSCGNMLGMVDLPWANDFGTCFGTCR